MKHWRLSPLFLLIAFLSFSVIASEKSWMPKRLQPNRTEERKPKLKKKYDFPATYKKQTQVNFSGETVPRHVNVKEDFGATGDGVTDDTEAIQKALNNPFGRPLFVELPVGDYRITSELLVGKKTVVQGAYDPYRAPGTRLLYDFEIAPGWTLSDPHIFLSRDLTISCLVRFDHLDNRRQKIVYLADDENKKVLYSLGKWEYGPKIEFAFTTGDGTRRWVFLSDTNLEVGRWYYIWAIRDQGTVRLYINGQPDRGTLNVYSGDEKLDEVPPWPGYADYGDCFRVGNSCRGADFMAGAIDEIRIYDRALSRDELPSPGTRGLKAQWLFEEQSTVRFFDSSGNGLNGVFLNVPGYERSLNPTYGWALWLDGERDFGMLPTQSDERALLTVRDEEVVIRGLELDGRKSRLLGRQRSSGVKIQQGAKNVLVDRVFSHDFSAVGEAMWGGDGIIIGRFDKYDNPASESDDAALTPQDIRLKNLALDRNGRNGLSVIRVDGLQVEGVRASDNEFVGIDIEPDAPDKGHINNVHISDVFASGNAWSGMAVNDVRDLDAKDIILEENGVEGLGINVFNRVDDPDDSDRTGTCFFSDIIVRHNGRQRCPTASWGAGCEAMRGGIRIRGKNKVLCRASIRDFTVEGNGGRSIQIIEYPFFSLIDGVIRGPGSSITLVDKDGKPRMREGRTENMTLEGGGRRPLSVVAPEAGMASPLHLKNILCDGGSGENCISLSGDRRNVLVE